MIFKTWLSDINKTAVALDNIRNIRFDSSNIAITKAYTESIRGLNEEQARYVLTKKYVKEADQNDLLIKAGIISANEGVEATELSRQLVLQGLKKEIAEALIEQEAGNKAISSNTILTKEQTASILKQAEARKLLSVEQSKNIANDIKETKTSFEESVAEETQTVAKLGSANSILSKGLSQAGRSLASFFSIFVSSPVAVIATITGGIIGLTYAIGKLQDTAKNAADKAYEFSSSMSSANSTYNNESQSLKELTIRYNDLRQQLIAAKGNEEETYNIKSQLLELQKQLNEIYGDEYDKVNLVTDAYKDQNGTLRKNAKQKAQNYLNEHTDEIETATKKMTTEYTYELGNFNYGFADANIGNELHDEIKQLAEKSGIEWYDKKGFVYKGTAEEASKVINQFMSDVRELQNSTDDLPDYFSDNFQSFFSDMSKQLGYADGIIEGYKETYETAQIAQIASDSSLSSTYNEAISAVEDYNEAVLKSENPYDDENVKKAWNNLQTVKQGIKDNEEEWGQYSNIMDNVFSSANDDVYSFYNAIQNDDALNGSINDLKELTDKDLLSMLNDGTEDSFDKLCESAKEYGLEVQDVIDLLVQLGIVQGEIQGSTLNENTTSSYKSSLDSVQSISDKLKTLMAVYDDVKDGGDFDWSSILNNDEFEEMFSSAGEVYDEFIQTITNNPDDITACQDAFDHLATSIIYNSDLFDGLTKESKDVAIAILEQSGVVNAAELVNKRLAVSEEYAALTGKELKDATLDDIASLLELGTASDETTNYLLALATQKIDLNNLKLDTKSDIDNICAIANAAGSSAEYVDALRNALEALQNAQSIRKNVQSGLDNLSSGTMSKLGIAIGNNALGLLDYQIEQAQAKVDSFNLDELFANIQSHSLNASDFYAKTGGSSKNSSSDSAKETAETFNWIETAISRIQRLITNLGKTVSATYRNWSTRNDALASEMNKVSEEISLQQQAYDAYMAKANSIGLSDFYKNLVQNGGIRIEDITDETLKEQISAFREW